MTWVDVVLLRDAGTPLSVEEVKASQRVRCDLVITTRQGAWDIEARPTAR